MLPGFFFQVSPGKRLAGGSDWSAQVSPEKKVSKKLGFFFVFCFLFSFKVSPEKNTLVRLG